MWYTIICHRTKSGLYVVWIFVKRENHNGGWAWILVLLENSISCSFCQWNLVWIILFEWQYWRYYDELSKSQFFSNFTNHQKDKLIALSMSSHHNSFRFFLFSSVSTSIFVTTLKHRCVVFLMLLCFVIIIIISIIIYIIGHV